MSSSPSFKRRIGIATGLVVVGDLIGEGSAREQSVVGETPNLAARLQALADPGAVVIAASTRRLVGDLFEYRDLAMIEVKGIAAPVPAWQVLRPSVVVEPVRGAARIGADTADRPRRGNRPAVAPLGPRQGGRRPGRADFRRAGHRQVANHGVIGGAPPRRAASPLALFLLALSPGQLALSVHRPARSSIWVRSRRSPRYASG